MQPQVSVIATVFNEAGSIGALLDSLASQTRTPDEIVISDAGSTDGTREAVLAAAPRLPVRLVDAPGDRSTGRNAAISAASSEIVACIDGGCAAEPDWLERLTEPFAGGTAWVAGFYRPQGASLRSTCIGLVMVPVIEEVDPESFLPSGRSMAFTKDAWGRVGGFPEGLDFAEDTLFGQRLFDSGIVPEFVAGAVVVWKPPSGFVRLARTLFRWGRGDGLAGLRGWHYKRLAATAALSAAATCILALVYPAATPLGLLPLAPGVVRRTRHKYRHAAGVLKYLWLPVADLTAAGAGLAGFLTGWWLGRRDPAAVAAWRTR